MADMQGLDASLDRYLAEGPENVWRRHALTAQACRAGALGEHADAAADYARQIPVRVTGRILGIPEEMSDRFVPNGITAALACAGKNEAAPAASSGSA